MDERLLFLYSLKDNWDSYGAKRPYQRSIVNANLVLSLFSEDTPEPCLVPTPCGGVQLEWAINGVDFEIECLENKFCCLFVVKDNIQIERSFEDHRRLKPLIDILTDTCGKHK